MMDIPTDRLLLVLILASSVAVFAVGWGLIDTGATGNSLALQVGLIIAFLAVVIGSWFYFRRIDRKRDQADERRESG